MPALAAVSPDLPPPVPRGAALFLDFDGTLAPIAPRPEDVQLPSWVVPTLRRLHATLDGALVVVSGRPLAEIDAFLSPLRLPAVGVHGVERRLADGRIRRHSGLPPASALDAALRLAAAHAGLRVERKPGGFALHYRLSPELQGACLDVVESALADDPQWEALRGHCVIEVKQRRVSKGAAVRAFLAERAFAGRVPVFVGDDTTDEDGIRASQAAGGVGIKVGAGASQARYRLDDVPAVARWLVASAEHLEAAGGGARAA
ncbi:MAG TPA: trehalose-phosphatase [Ideonella sp.]|nr:trehalose-phosphatase [Ideonella sp.]